MKNVLKLSFLVMVVLLTSCKTAKYPDLSDGLYADLQTSKGDILLFLEYENTPVTVANFVSLAEGTNPFVAEEFHKLIPNSQLHFIDKCGHAPMMEVPGEFNDLLFTFLQSLPK